MKTGLLSVPARSRSARRRDETRERADEPTSNQTTWQQTSQSISVREGYSSQNLHTSQYTRLQKAGRRARDQAGFLIGFVFLNLLLVKGTFQSLVASSCLRQGAPCNHCTFDGFVRSARWWPFRASSNHQPTGSRFRACISASCPILSFENIRCLTTCSDDHHWGRSADSEAQTRGRSLQFQSSFTTRREQHLRKCEQRDDLNCSDRIGSQ